MKTVKRFFKWIFKSNPKTMTAISSIAVSALLAALEIAGAMNWGVATPIVSSVLAVIGAALAGHGTFLESNATADERKATDDPENKQD